MRANIQIKGWLNGQWWWMFRSPQGWSSVFGNIVVRTKFVPPVTKNNLFPRQQLGALFANMSQYPVTVIQAGPGYGKSTALAAFFKHKDVFWYSVDRGDGDVLTFILHLVYAFNTVKSDIGDKTLELIREKGEGNQDWTPILNSLVNEIWDHYRLDDVYLVIDDYNLVSENPGINQVIEHLVEHRPPHFHLVISTRIVPAFSTLAGWRVKDQILEIRQEDLRLTEEEIVEFFGAQYGYALTKGEAALIFDRTEGWLIALEMIWQGLRRGLPLETIQDQPTNSLEHLFEYLAQEVLAKQKPEIREFLVKTSLLRVMTPDSCDFVRKAQNSGEILKYLQNNGLFTFRLAADKYRYHHLFHDFLRGRAAIELKDVDVMHKELLEFFRERGDFEEAIYHGLEGKDHFPAARILVENAPELLAKGRFSAFRGWFECLPERVRESFPHLCLFNGDIFRFSSNFKEALEWYNEGIRLFRLKKDNAGLSLAYQKAAMVYLDTVQPAKADVYLQTALELREKENNWEEATLVRLLAENRLNSGRIEEAKKLQERLKQLSEENPGHILDARVKIRTGRLGEAERILEKALSEEGGSRTDHVGRAHRETYLLLSLIASLKGEAEKAIRFAQLGLEQGEKLGSEFTRAVAYMRLGHAYQVAGGTLLPLAVESYEKALRIVDQLDVPRGRAEALWGLTLIYGHLKRKEEMMRYAGEGINICLEAGDEWLGALIELSLGIGHMSFNDHKNAARALAGAVKRFDSCNDLFGKTVGQAWLCLGDLSTGNDKEFSSRFEALISSVEKHHFDFVFDRTTLLGPRDPSLFMPLVCEGYNRGIKTGYCRRFLEDSGVEPGVFHPGYTLRVRTLGQFQVFRGGEEIKPGEWKRSKAKTLFQILITHRNDLLAKEQLAELLSPEKDGDLALLDFKVALNALNNTLEPEREARATPFFVVKRDSRYGLNSASCVRVDADEFIKLIKLGLECEARGEKEPALKALSEGLDMYQGPYLPDALYEDWSQNERTRLKELFVRGAGSLAAICLEMGDYPRAVQVSERLLSEEPCAEEGYQLLMKALSRLGQRSRVVQVYRECCEVLERELGLEPGPATQELFEEIKSTA